MDIDEVLEREQLALAGMELAKENLRVARISYREGVGVMLDVITAQNNLQQAQNNLVTARFDLNIRRAALYQALGLDIIDQLR
jgi:outer membrane protein TolC